MPQDEKFAVKWCPFCGHTEWLQIFIDHDNPERGRLVMCNLNGHGCGAMAPIETWNLRRPAIALMNTNPPLHR